MAKLLHRWHRDLWKLGFKAAVRAAALPDSSTA